MINRIYWSINITGLLMLFALLTALTSCSDEGSVTKENIYKPCCGIQPTINTQGNYSVYTPNVFTPNNDGINDVFYPILNNDSIVISGFFIKTMTDTIIHFRQQLYYENIQHEAWGGITYENPFFPELQRTEHKGPFKYEFTIIYPDGNLIDVSGTACTVRCGSEAAALKGKLDCFYPNQVNNNVFDPEISPGEEACFE